MEKVFAKKESEIIDNGFKERHLFSAAITPEGYVDYTDSILELVSEVYYISGNMGTGKSTILKKIIEEAKTRDYHIEIYHNSLIPEKVESIFIKELDTMITSNKNGNRFAKTKIDLDNYFDNKDLNEEDYETFKLLVEKGIKNLNGAKENHFILEKSYKLAINYRKVTEIQEKIYKEILDFK